MSGKKGSNRVKGNLKPSSSSQAASLLAGQTPGFIGFGAQTSPSFVPLSHILDDVDSTLDSDVRLLLRKLSKRDTTTKIKALQELGAICQQKDADVIKSMLPFWPRLYNRLSIDTDHKVREAVQQTFLIITSQVKKEIAPYLKSIMGCWILSQCDTYPTVASAANQAFHNTFPSGKQNEALTIYRQEIINYFVDNLVNKTAQSLSDSKTTDSEDMESKYTRTVASSLLGCRKLISAIPEDKLSTLVSSIISLFENGKFWKHGKSVVPSVKAGLYSFLAVVCQRYPEVANSYSSKLTPLVLHNLDISNPLIVGSMWEAILSLVNYSPVCWEHISLQKAFWPKLRKSLEGGCHGNASTIAPNLMPLLSKIPVNLYQSDGKSTFYLEFLTSMRTGFKVESVSQSNIESSALIKAYIECCRYTINQTTLVENPKEEISKNILDVCILDLLKSTLTEEKISAIASPLYSCVGSFMKSLDKSSKDKGLSEYFWNQIRDFLFTLLKDQSHGITDRLSALMKGFLVPSFSTKKALRFADNSVQKYKRDPVTVLVNPDTLSDSFSDFYASILVYVYSEMIVESKQELYLPFFADMFDLYITKNILSKLLSLEENQDKNIFVEFFKVACMPWLKSSSRSYVSSENIVTISFKCLENVETVDCSVLLPELIENCNGLIQRCIVIEKLTEKRKFDPKAGTIFRSSSVTQMILGLVRETCVLSTKTDNSDNNELIERGWSVITLVLSSCGEEETVYDNDCVEAVILAIGEVLNSLNHTASNSNLVQVVQFVTRAACSFFDNLKDILCPKASEELMMTLFRISVDSFYNLEKKVLECCERAWSKGLILLLKSEVTDLNDDGFLYQACILIKKLVSAKETNRQSLIRLLKSVEILLNNVKYNTTSNKTILHLLLQLLHIPFGEKECLKYISLLGYVYISGDVLSAAENLPQHISVSSANHLPVLVNQGTLNAQLVLFCRRGGMSVTISEESSDKIVSSESNLSININDYLIHVFQALSISKTLLVHEKLKSCQLLTDIKNLEGIVQAVKLALTDYDKKQLLQKAITDSEEEGKLKSLLLAFILDAFVPKYCSLNFDEMMERWNDLSCGIVHSIQTLAPFFPSSKAQRLAEIQIPVLISSMSTTNEWLGYRSLAVITSCLSSMGKNSQPEIFASFRSLVNNVLQIVRNWRGADDHFMVLTDEDLNDIRKVLSSIEVAKFLNIVIVTAPESISDKEWDMVLCCVVDWVHRIKSCAHVKDPHVTSVAFATAVSRLLLEISKCINEKVKYNASEYPECLSSEWKEFFSEAIFGELIPVYIALPGRRCCSAVVKMMITALGKSLSYCNKCHILKHKLPVYLDADDDSLLEQDTQTFLNHFCPYLLCEQLDVQKTVYSLLEKIMGEVAKQYQELGKEDGSQTRTEESCIQSPPKVLMGIVKKGRQAMELVLGNLSIGEQYIISPHSEEFQFVYGYMLAWKLVLTIFKTANPQMRAKYATYLKENGLMAGLLRHIFCLLPSERTLAAVSTSYFISNSIVNALNTSDVDVQQQAYSLLYQCLETTPALVRQWWMDLDRKTSLYVDKFTSKYVSPLLCGDEISAVQPSSEDLEGITIKPRPSTREVVATYIMAEVKIVVTITLPENFPLGVIAVSSDKRVGATQAQWDRWLLQLNIFLQHQNGTIIEGLKLWKKNIDKRFDGVEDCMICFSVLHGTTFQLPKLQCRTCKKKYHSACLYKWFSTSMNSTCPLCRNLF
ncbi:E3 ubiquitin-protein ligase listerin [Patella vulgata]|uniref:E3 ubiquitin-protein ligase listerin n=1 Tax=Patella vulgata TaxID=6465 RepID=UPI0021803CC3|nr:E3 ubiquitin-protein ligase listerin [Patella vulgata]